CRPSCGSGRPWLSALLARSAPSPGPLVERIRAEEQILSHHGQALVVPVHAFGEGGVDIRREYSGRVTEMATEPSGGLAALRQSRGASRTRSFTGAHLIYDLLEPLLHGLTLGAMYAMVAAGLALMLGVARLINFAHGEFFMLGAYVFWFGYSELGLPY